MQKKALGRGLETLIPVGPPVAAREDRQDIREIPLSQIRPNPYQPRRLFDDSTLRELADSVRTKGVIQPVLVRRLGDGQFELIAGERRVRAARLAGLQKIPSIVRPATDTESIEMALIENLQRKDLNPIEEAKAYHRLMKEFGLTQEELSARLGKERSSIANTARLLSLPAEVQAWVEEERLSLGHAKVLLGIEDETQQIRLGRQAVKERLSVRDLERLLGKVPRSGLRHSGRKARPSALEDQLTRRLGTKVRLIEGKIGGKIVVEYYSAAELDRLVDLLLG